MPTSIVARSTVLPDHYWEVTRSYSESGVIGNNGLDMVNAGFSYTESATVAHDNALSSSIVGLVNYGARSYVADTNTFTSTPATYHAGSGGVVSITIPPFQEKWGRQVSYGWLIAGNTRIQHTVTTETNCSHYEARFSKGSVTSSPSSILGPGNVTCQPATSPNWVAQSPWINYACGDPNLVNGREPFVARQKYAVCDAGYTPPISLEGGYPFTNSSESFHLLSDADRPIAGADGTQPGHSIYGGTVSPFISGPFQFRTWTGNSQGTTVNLNMYIGAPVTGGFGMLKTFQTVGAAVTRTYQDKIRVTLTGAQFIVYVGFDGEADLPNSGAGYIPMDCYDGIIAACWTGAASNGKKQFYIGTQPALTANIGSGSGSTGGWLTYLYGDIDERSEIGLYYLPSGALVVMFDEYAGAVKTKRYIVNEVGGRKPLSNWSAPATVTADGTATHGAGRAMSQAWKVRVGS